MYKLKQPIKKLVIEFKVTNCPLKTVLSCEKNEQCVFIGNL